MSEADPPETADKTVIVVMGIAGSGKTTIARILAERLGWTFAEADHFHSPANVAKMAAGTPLTDQDRWPWLESLVAWIDGNPGDAVITCSALRRAYRDVLRHANAKVRFLHLRGTIDTIGGRIAARTSHFMPATLLDSQVATLEPLEMDEDGVVVNVSSTPERIADQALEALKR
jgi:gluconokinase